MGAAVAIGVLWMPAGARASVVSTDADTGPDAAFFVVYDAARGERNQVTVSLRGGRVAIVDRGVRRIRFGRGDLAGCKVKGRQKVVCDEAVVWVRLRDGDDVIHFIPGDDRPERARTNPFELSDPPEDEDGGFSAKAVVEAGRGDDVVTGSRGPDVITPGPGRDRVEGRAGDDSISISPDSVRDRIAGGGGADGLLMDTARRPLMIDLARGVAGPAGEKDAVSGFERVHGGSGDDTILGGDRAEALYGQSGSDRISGGGGNDLLTGDAPQDRTPSPNSLDGGDGNDALDARQRKPVPTTRVECGAGNDVESGEVDDLLAPGCESVVFRFTGRSLEEENLFEPPYQRALPVSVAADGSPAFEVRCPRDPGFAFDGCAGMVELARPGGESYGSGSFDLEPGARANVRVQLNPAGHAAVAAGEPVAIHVTADSAVDYGWQTVIPR